VNYCRAISCFRLDWIVTVLNMKLSSSLRIDVVSGAIMVVSIEAVHSLGPVFLSNTVVIQVVKLY